MVSDYFIMALHFFKNHTSFSWFNR